MFDRSKFKHLSGPDLVRLIDEEVSGSEAEAMRDHIAHCPECRVRVEQAEETLGSLDNLLALQTIEAAPAADLSRLRLQHGMAAASPHRPSPGRTALAVGIAALILVAAGLAFSRWPLHAGPSHDVVASALPDRSLTPGSIRPVTFGDICPSADDDLDPDVPASTRQAVLHEYGIRASGPGTSYQIDYLVNPQLGGTSDIRNLWPQPDRNAVWNARAKDELERRLHQMVCDRTVDLTVAQQEIETDWIAAYRKYIHRQYPS